jgi:hypothetical protein
MAKDVRQTRWPLTLYLVVLGVATLQAMQSPRGSLRPPDFPVMYLVVITGTFVAALVVQDDSPTRSDAFWASRPLYSSAVLAAKAATVFVVVLGAGMIAQSMVFVWLGEPPANFVRLMVRSSWIYALWLMIAMLIASISRDLRTFIATLAVVPLAFPFTRVSSLFALQRLAPPRTALFAAVAIGVAGSIAALVSVYRTRKRGRAIWVLAVGAVVCMLLGIFTNPWARWNGRFEEHGEARYALYLDKMIGPRGLDRLAVGLPDVITSDRYTAIDSAVVRIRLSDGNTLVLTSSPHAIVAYPTLPLPTGIQWLGALPPANFSGANGIRANRRQLDSLAAGIANVSIDVFTWSARPSLVATLPLRAEARQRRGGKIARVLRMGTQAEGDTLALIAMTSISVPETTWGSNMGMLFGRVPEFALVNRRRGEAVIPIQRRIGGSSASTPLPGLWRTVMVTEVPGGIQSVRGPRPAPVGRDWIDEADVLAFDWIPIGRGHYRIDNAEVRQSTLPNELDFYPRSPQTTRSPR